jgi:hypothetical protein
MLPKCPHRLNELDLAVIELGLELLVVENLAGGFHKVFFQHVIAIGPNGKQASFGAQVAHVGAVQTISELHDRFVVDITPHGNTSGVNFENFQALRFVGFGDFNLTIEATGSQQGWVENIRPVGRHDHLDGTLTVETVHLIQQFHLWCKPVAE